MSVHALQKSGYEVGILAYELQLDGLIQCKLWNH